MNTNRYIAILTMLLAAVYLWGATQISSLNAGIALDARTFPVMLGAILALTGVVMFLQSFRVAASQESPPVGEGRKAHARTLGMITGVVLWSLLYFLVFEPIGYLLTTAVYLFVLLAAFNRARWLANLLTALLFPVISYVVFVHFLHVSLPAGLLGL